MFLPLKQDDKTLKVLTLLCYSIYTRAVTVMYEAGCG